MDMQKSRLSSYKQGRLIEHFVSGSTARTAAKLVNVNKTTAAYYFHRLRKIIVLETDNATLLSGAFEVDESYFGGIRKGKVGQGTSGGGRGQGNYACGPGEKGRGEKAY